MAKSSAGSPGDRGGTLPGVLSPVVLRVGDVEVRTMIVDIELAGEAPLLVVAGGDPLTPTSAGPRGQTVLAWTAEQAQWELPVVVARATRPYGAVLLATPVGAPRRLQRREFFRVRVSGGATLIRPPEAHGDEAMRLGTELIDISEGGLSVVLRAGTTAPPAGTTLRLEAELMGRRIDSDVVVVRPLSLSHDRSGLALRFTEPERHGDFIRKVAFAEQRKAAVRR